jgi:acylphosphatase
MTAERREIRFTGRVQGVGFRYTTSRIAEQFPVTGWVRNLADGSVQCVVEGATDEIERFLAAVRTSMADNIAEAEVRPAPATGEFDGFTIKF